MKIDFRQIVLDHFDTLRNDQSKKVSFFDIGLFYVLPLALAALSYLSAIRFDRDVYNASITFFGIFVALLLNVQVAIFGIFQRKFDLPTDPKLVDAFKKRLDKRKELLGELNANLSYLTLVCCVALVAFLSLYTFQTLQPEASALTVLFYAHFMLTLMMTVKRTHVLFQQEYRA